MAAVGTERVLSVRHWNETVFSFSTTRDPSLRFENGHFVMVGLLVDNKPLMRAYSIASANHEDFLEFLSIKVSDGPLTSRLQHIKARRSDPGEPQAHRHTAAARPQAREAVVPARIRHGSRTLPQLDQGPGSLRALRESRPGARRPIPQRAGLSGFHRIGTHPSRIPRPAGAEPTRVFSDRHARALSLARPDHGADRNGASCSRRPACRRSIRQ